MLMRSWCSRFKRLKHHKIKSLFFGISVGNPCSPITHLDSFGWDSQKRHVSSVGQDWCVLVGQTDAGYRCNLLKCSGNSTLWVQQCNLRLPSGFQWDSFTLLPNLQIFDLYSISALRQTLFGLFLIRRSQCQEAVQQRNVVQCPISRRLGYLRYNRNVNGSMIAVTADIHSPTKHCFVAKVQICSVFQRLLNCQKHWRLYWKVCSSCIFPRSKEQIHRDNLHP